MTILLGENARKFTRQVVHGRPKKAAIEAVRRGVALARELAERGSIRLRIAIATEARSAETENTGSVHEGAGRQGDAEGRRLIAYGDKDYHSLSPLLEQLSPEELLEVLTPRRMIAALRVYEARNPDHRHFAPP